MMVGVREHLVRPARPAATAVAPERIQRRATRRGAGAVGRRLGFQAKLIVGAADDRFEQEADAVADAMTRSTAEAPTLGRTFPGEVVAPPASGVAQRAVVVKGEDPEKSKRKDDEPPKKLQKAALAVAAAHDAPPSVEATVARSAGGGSALPALLRQRLEGQLGHDLGHVRIHTSLDAAATAARIGARAFTVGRDVFFGRGEYRPGTPAGDKLIAHEVTHTIQQRGGTTRLARSSGRQVAGQVAGIVAGQVAGQAARVGGRLVSAPGRAIGHAAVSLSTTAAMRVQRGLLDDGIEAVLRRVRGWATRVPGYDLLTVFLGRDPITDEPVERSAVNLVHGALKLVPHGEEIFADLQQSRTIERTVTWLEQEWARVNLTWTTIKDLFRRAWDALSWTDIFDPGDAWEKIKRIFLPPIERLIAFVVAVGRRIFEAIKERVIGFLREHAEGIPGYKLLTFILGRDPLTDQPVPRTAENFVRAVLDLVPGGEAIFQNLQRSRTIERTVTWLRAQIATLDLTWDGIKALFRRAWDVLEITDLLHPLSIVDKVVDVFGPAVRRVGRFALAVGKKVLEFIFEGVMILAGPVGTQVVRIFRRASDAFDRIVADPVGFIRNLVNGIKQGFDQFGRNIATHLREGIFGWLFGALEGAGLTLPTVWDLRGIVSLVLQVLGLTYQRFRVKLVNLIGEPKVAMLERIFDFLVVLLTQGLAAAWQKIVDAIGSVTDLVIGAIRSWAITRIVTAAITKLATMFNPVGAIIQSIIAIYNTIQFFVERIQQILNLVEAVVESIANIAAGRLAAAANYVERSMARTIPVILSFLARLIGLGDISGAIKNVIVGIQARVDAAIDRVIAWVIEKGKALFGRNEPAAGPAGPEDPKWTAGVAGVHGEIEKLRNDGLTPQLLEQKRGGWAQQFGFKSLTIEPTQAGFDVDGEMSPRKAVDKVKGIAPIFQPTVVGNKVMAVRAIPLIATSYASPSADTMSGWMRLEHTRWVRGHVLHGKSGGPGTANNLVPISKSANGLMWNRHESEIYTESAGRRGVRGQAAQELRLARRQGDLPHEPERAGTHRRHRLRANGRDRVGGGQIEGQRVRQVRGLESGGL